MLVDGVKISAVGFEFSDGEAENYIDYVKKHVDTHGEELTEIIVTMCDDGKVDVNYKLEGEKFERIRRVTGYLTGTTDCWNNAKRAEERERVKHGIEDYD